MARLIGLIGIVMISFSAIFVRLADVSPTTAAFFRAAYAVPALFVIARLLRRQDRRDSRAHWMALGSGLLLAADLLCWHRAIESIGAGLGTVLGNTQIAFVGIAAWLLHKERPSRSALVIIPLVFLGVALVSGLGRPGAYGDDPLAGVFYGVLTGFFFGAFLLVFRASNRELAPVAGPLFEATCGVVVGTLAFGVFDPRFSLAPSWPAHGWLVALALGSQVTGWLFIAHALPRLAALETSVQLLVQPMLAVLWGRLIFAEYLSSLQWMGVGFILGGVGLLSVRGTIDSPLPKGAMTGVTADVEA
ncbi:MAG TPA: DMT family transporter [Vicinamibacteria bacterium]|nr:DMT family transporter [Vicinamibacteria bacterium]